MISVSKIIVAIGISTALVGTVPTVYAQPSQIFTAQAISAKEFLELGIKKANQDNLKGAIADFTEAIKIKRDYSLAYYNRGYVRMMLGDYKKAIEDNTQALRANKEWGDKSSVDAYNNRAAARFALGDAQGAIADFSEVIRRVPNNHLAYYNRGNAYRQKGDNQRAIADYTKSIQLDRQYALAYLNRGTTRISVKDNQGAIADFSQAIKLKPNYALAYKNRGLLRANLGDKKGAVEDLQKAVQFSLAQENTALYEESLQLLNKLK